MGDIVALQIFFNYYNSVKNGFKFLPRKQDRPVLNREQDSPAVNVMPPMKLWSGDGRRRHRDACPCALATASRRRQSYMQRVGGAAANFTHAILHLFCRGGLT